MTKEEKKALKKKRIGVLNEFKIFIMRGNVIDMAVGVIVATAFTQIVSSLTNGIFMPLINFLIGDIKFDSIKTILRHQELDIDGNILKAEVSLNWGLVISNIINFILIALIIFSIIKIINRIRNKMTLYKEKIISLKKDEKEELVEVVETKEEEVVVKKTTNELLEKIIELLEKNNS